MRKSLSDVFYSMLPWRKTIVILMLAAVAGGIVFSIFSGGDLLKQKEIAAGAAAEREKIATLVIEEIDVNESIEALGQVVFREKVNLSSKVSGRLSRINIREGQRVRKGEVIAEIERLPLEISLKQQEAELDIAKKSLELAEAKYNDALKGVEIKLKSIVKARAEVNDKRVSYENMDNILKNKTVLFEAGGVSESELKNVKTEHTTLYTRYELAKADYEIQQVGYRDEDIISEGLSVPATEKGRIDVFKRINTKIERAEVESAGSRVKQAENNLLSTRIMLDETYIRSPINGIAAARNMETGEMVREDSVITTVIDISSVYISMNINERDLVRINKGQSISFSADAMGNSRSFTARLETVSPVLDTKSRTAEVKAITFNPSGDLLPGMFVRAIISTGKQERGIVIPASAVLKKDDGKSEVYVVKNSIVFRINVVTAGDNGGDVRVTEGLSPGDIIITGGLNSVYQGMRVE